MTKHNFLANSANFVARSSVTLDPFSAAKSLVSEGLLARSSTTRQAQMPLVREPANGCV